MRYFAALIWTLTTALGFATAAERPRVELADEKLPLVELRPLDRRVWILSLAGKWLTPATAGKSYYVNVLLPNGQSDSHRPLNEDLFRAGEVRAVIQDHVVRRAGVADVGKLRLVISEGRPVASPNAPEVVSNVLEVPWPLDRPIVPKLPRTRFSPLPPVDPFPPGPNELPPRGPGRPPPRPEAEPLPPPKPADGV
jgi:hypothetical protein